MNEFPHLNFREKLTGSASFGRNISDNPRTKNNHENRIQHSQTLLSEVNLIHNAWFAHIKARETKGLAPLNPNIQPIYLEIDTDLIDSNLEVDLLSFGIEIISQEDDGFILGASLDNLQSLKEKIEGFATEAHGTAKIAKFYKIVSGDHSAWKPHSILSADLFGIWRTIPDDAILDLEVSIAFGIPTPKKPDQSKKHGLVSRNERYEQALFERDDKQQERENHFREFIEVYGTITSSIVDLEDSLGCEISISGKGLRDLILNYPFVFDIKEIDIISGGETEESDSEIFDLEIIPPDNTAPVIGVIDSGLMEQHRYLRDSIDDSSRSYISGDNDVDDKVQNGGHGSRVGGAILYPKGISELKSPYQLPFKLRNIRVLNDQNILPMRFPPELMERIVKENDDIRIFNLSINSRAPSRLKHMSNWAAMLDKLIHQNNILFINSVGNVNRSDIRDYIINGTFYPEYLDLPNNRLANPSQSSFSIAVGSVNSVEFDEIDKKSIGKENQISAFSRVGLGIWDHVKPDVVEYGGGMQISKDDLFLVSNKDTCTELLRSTYDGGPAFGKDTVGTSFAAPKVTNIISHLARIYPDANINLWRALIVQGARLPNEHFANPTIKSLRHYGYGIPLLKNVTENNEHRVTFYVSDKIIAKEGKIYGIAIPEQMRDQGDEYDILIEVTLSYTAKARRTRQKTRSYVGTWLDWSNSKLGEPYEEFKLYTMKIVNDGNRVDYDKEQRGNYDTLKWKLGKSANQGEIAEHRRNNSTLQKDYCILKSHQLPKDISFAVHAHNGWDKNNHAVPFAFTVSFEILGQNIPIYHEMRIENEIEIEAASI